MKVYVHRYLLFIGILFCCSSWSNAQSLNITRIEVINDAEMDERTGKFKSDEAAPLFVAQLVMEVEGDLSQLANIEVKLSKISRDLKSEEVVVDRKIAYSIDEFAERGARILQKESIVLLELGTFPEPAYFKAKVTLEDRSGKKSKPVFYRPIQD